MKYILGFLTWILKPVNDHASLRGCIDSFNKAKNKKIKKEFFCSCEKGEIKRFDKFVKCSECDKPF